HSSAVTPLGHEFRVNTFTTSGQFNPAVAMDAAGDFVVAWVSNGQDGDFHGVYAQRYSSAGTPQGDEFRVNSFTTSSQSEPAVAMDAAGDFVIVWSGYGQDGDFSGIFGQRYRADGTPQGGEFLVTTVTSGGQTFPAGAMDP